MATIRPRVILETVSVPALGAKNSITIDPSDLMLQLVNDVNLPGNNYNYGTNSSGVKGWYLGGTVADGSITNAKLANMAQSTIKGRAAGAGTGVPVDLSAAQVKTLLAIAGTEVSNTPAGNIAATTVQAAINELDTEKQPLNTNLTVIAAISATNDDIIQRKAGAWTNRTVAQYKADLALNNVDNTSDVNKPVSTAQATAIALKVSKAGDLMSGYLDMGGYGLVNVVNPTNPQDTATKAYADLKVLKAGDTMSGALAMGGNKITGLAAATANGDAVRFEQVPIFTKFSGSWAVTNINNTVAISTGITSTTITGITVCLRDQATGIIYTLPNYSGDGTNATYTEAWIFHQVAVSGGNAVIQLNARSSGDLIGKTVTYTINVFQ